MQLHYSLRIIHTYGFSFRAQRGVCFLFSFVTLILVCVIWHLFSVHTVYEYDFLEYDQLILSRCCSLITATLNTDIQDEWGVEKVAILLGKLNNAAINSDLLRQTT
jgi:hypothetical protein